MPFFNTSLLEPQKPDFSLKKATKVKDHEAQGHKGQKKFGWGNFFYLISRQIGQFLVIWQKFFFGLLRPLKAIKAKKAKILLSKCIKTDCLSE